MIGKWCPVWFWMETGWFMGIACRFVRSCKGISMHPIVERVILHLLICGTSCSTAIGQVIVSDQTLASGLVAEHQPRLDGYPFIQERFVSGIAIADVDRDGWPDVFVLAGGNAPDKLFMNNGDGTFTEDAMNRGLDAVHCGSSIAAGDYDGDGHIDFYVTSFGNATNDVGEIGKNLLYRNLGDGFFEQVALEAGVAFNTIGTPGAFGSCFGDYDLDGDLDLFIAAYQQFDGSRLFRNEGDGTFVDVTAAAGIDSSGLLFFQGNFTDIDDDGWPDLLIAGDFFGSAYFRNNGDGTFSNITLESGTGIERNGMGQCIADFDNDGLLDWYVTSIHFQIPGLPDNNGNMLYRNLGNHMYEEVSVASGVNDGGWGWGTCAADLDLDGLQDIIEVNGHFCCEWELERERIYWNLGGMEFMDTTVLSGFGLSDDVRAVNTFDYDRDGDLDFVVYCYDGPLRLYRNDSPRRSRHWLELELDTSTNPLLPPDGFGAKITVDLGKTQLLRHVDGGPSFLGTSELLVHFGLGNARIIKSIQIDWPLGYTTTLVDVPVDQVLQIVSPVPGDFNGDGAINGVDLGVLLGNWLTPFGDINGDGMTDGVDLGFLLGGWR